MNEFFIYVKSSITEQNFFGSLKRLIDKIAFLGTLRGSS